MGNEPSLPPREVMKHKFAYMTQESILIALKERVKNHSEDKWWRDTEVLHALGYTMFSTYRFQAWVFKSLCEQHGIAFSNDDMKVYLSRRINISQKDLGFTIELLTFDDSCWSPEGFAYGENLLRLFEEEKKICISLVQQLVSGLLNTEITLYGGYIAKMTKERFKNFPIPPIEQMKNGYSISYSYTWRSDR